MMQTMRWISAALLLASLLIGLAHVAGLPPFEGFDENRYIEQLKPLSPNPARHQDSAIARYWV